MSVYGRDFSAVYNERWSFWGRRMWPFLARMIARHQPEAHSWLDLCCGAGSLLELVCEYGYSAVGVDLSPHQLAHARHNAPAARLVQADVRDFSLPDRFGVITCLFDSLNYLTTQADLYRALRRARRHLAEDGLFIFDVNTYLGLKEHWHSTFAIREQYRVLIVESSFDDRRARGRCTVTGFLREGRHWRRFDEEHIERGYTPEELAALIRRAGFSFRSYDGRTLSRPRKRSARLVYVCHRC